MNNDLIMISREALKNFINKVCFSKEEEWVKFRVDNGSRGQIERILAYIDNASTPFTDVVFDKDKPIENDKSVIRDEKPYGEWIPCSEGLPENNVEVLVTTENGHVTTAAWLGHQWFIYKRPSNSHIGKLIAWMPLPDPYKEGDAQ